MRNLSLLTILALLFTYPLLAQPNISWTKTFGGNTDDYAECVVPIGQDYIIGGYSKDEATGFNKAHIFRMNNRGKRVWDKFYKDKKERTSVEMLIPSSDKKHIIAALSLMKKKSYRKIRMLKLDLEGNIVWSTDIAFKESINATSIVENSDNEILVCYDKSTSNDEYYNVGITKISGEGEIQWDKVIEHKYDDFPIGMKKTYDGEHFVLLSELSLDRNSTKSVIRMRTLNNSGKVEKTTDLDWLNGMDYTIDQFDIDEVGNVVFCGDDLREDEFHCAIFLADSEGKKLMQTSWAYGIIPNAANDVVFDVDGNILVVGKSLNILDLENDDNWDMWVSKFTPKGDLKWYKEIGGTYNDEAFSVAIGTRGQLVVVGHTAYAEDEKDVSIVELVEDGKGIVSKVPPKVWAVVVGVSDYSDKQNREGWGDLRFCDDDAQRVFEFLQSSKGGALPDEQISLLMNEKATHDNILAEAERLYTKAKPNDLVIFYFSGHGGPNIFAGHDGSVSHSELKEIIAASGVNKRLCIADACYSGTFNSEEISERRQLSEDEMNQIYYQHLGRSSEGMALFMSSASNETSLEMGSLKQGAFTYYYIEGLKGGADANKDKIITVSELYDYVYKNVSEKTGQHQHPQLKGIFDHDMPVGVTR
ncbi:MAG: caspase family protein [Saprospiraceae bacterium]|nr:caspase family protein [Saprospiraceae bacterium]